MIVGLPDAVKFGWHPKEPTTTTARVLLRMNPGGIYLQVRPNLFGHFKQLNAGIEGSERPHSQRPRPGPGLKGGMSRQGGETWPDQRRRTLGTRTSVFYLSMVVSTFAVLAIAVTREPETKAADSLDFTLPPGAVVCFPPRLMRRLLTDPVHQST